MRYLVGNYQAAAKLPPVCSSSFAGAGGRKGQAALQILFSRFHKFFNFTVLQKSALSNGEPANGDVGKPSVTARILTFRHFFFFCLFAVYFPHRPLCLRFYHCRVPRLTFLLSLSCTCSLHCSLGFTLTLCLSLSPFSCVSLLISVFYSFSLFFSFFYSISLFVCFFFLYHFTSSTELYRLLMSKEK